MALAAGGGDRRDAAAPRAPRGGADLDPAALALALLSGDGPLLARPAPRAPRPPDRPRPPAPPRAASRRRLRLVPGREPDAGVRGRRARFSPYAPAADKPDLLRSVLERRLAAARGAPAARPPA
ncbi:uncharacterized protein C11orf71 homolog [Sorex fumeus]|uniref:uncharacterized protein C11orf71 homolog n=1 Tax=Sorex fumeus TaxID=62283 RepID=UPI0024AE4E82|nr:uncharacterized protein C11orf71 homolog [Sorex fumeus]